MESGKTENPHDQSIESSEGDSGKLGKTKGSTKNTGKAKARSKPARRHNKDYGERGEDAAAQYLYRRGYSIESRNWVCPAGEADIVARDKDTLVFVEVKTRSGHAMGFPEDAVDDRKRKRYERIAATYLADNDVGELQIRFDIIAIDVIAENRAFIRHHINAFAAA